MEHPNHPIRKWLIGAAIVVVLIYYGARFATDVMWFRQMQYLGVYLKLVITQVVMSAIAAAIAFLFPYWSLRRARRKVESDDTYIIGSEADDYIDKSMVEEHVDKGILITSAILLGLTLPITPLQVLWINMVSSVALALTLAFEPAEPGTLSGRRRCCGR